MAAFETAKENFLAILAGLSTDGERVNFLNWIRSSVLDELPSDFGLDSRVVDGRTRLRIISEFARQLVPNPAGVFPSECIHPPKDESGNLVEALDAFLYDEKDEELLVEEGKLSRNFCLDCGSRRTSEVELVTHSCSRERIEFIFRSLLPPIPGKTVVDLGSRLGAVLYGAYFYSDATRIVGVEMNPDLCRIQRQIVAKFSLEDRISIVEAEMTSRPDVLAAADVVFVNNVSEWFVPMPEFRVTMWQFIRQHLKPGALLVTIPDIETALNSLKQPTGILLNQWLRELSPAYPERTPPAIFEGESSEVRLYQSIQ